MQVNNIPNVRTCIAPLKQGINVITQKQLPTLTINESDYYIEKESIIVDVLVIGAGPAGLEATLEASKQGLKVLLVDENQRVGGQLVKQTHKFFGSKHEKAGIRGINIAKNLEEELYSKEIQEKVTVMLDSTVFGFYEGKNNDNYFTFGVIKRHDYKSQLIEVNTKSVIFAVGAMENMLLFPGNDLPGVYGAGAVQTLMNVYGVKPGENILMVGAGNVGLIVSYQLIQAGVNVNRVVEAAPIIGGYHVHAAKLRRLGVPIYTKHSIKEVFGKEKVKGAIIVKLDDNWEPIPGSEEKIKCDTVCLAVGLTPSTRLADQMGIHMETIPEAGGYIAIHDKSMQTSVKNVYIAGDSSGIEEASTAMIEGKIAGISATINLGFKSKNAEKQRIEYLDQLKKLRAGPFGKKPRIAKEKISTIWRKKYE
jgi:sarcosine oxidase subunit alpha